MTPRATLLVAPADGWGPTLASALLPGAHAIILVEDELAGIEGRRSGLELRDTLLVLSQGPHARFAFLFRKPLAATVAEQVLVTGTGSMNIAACRISHSEPDRSARRSVGKFAGNSYATDDYSIQMGVGKQERVVAAPSGRWPTNLVLVHAPGCHQQGTKRVRSNGHHPARRGAAGVWSREGGGLNGNDGSNRYMGSEGGLEMVPAWSCVSACPIRILDEQSGDRPSTLTGRADPTQAHVNPGDNGGASLFGGGNSNVYADAGGASRFYPQFLNDEELLDWLQKLIEPVYLQP